MKMNLVPRSYLLATILLVAMTLFPSGAFAAAPADTPNPLQVAILRWYPANTAGLQFAVGPSPIGVAFDGANIWVTSQATSGTVTELRASDGTNLGTYPVGDMSAFIAFDGTQMWVTNSNGNTISKL